MACEGPLAAALFVGSNAAFLVDCLYRRIEQGAMDPSNLQATGSAYARSLEKLLTCPVFRLHLPPLS
jgi:hypothetical protein